MRTVHLYGFLAAKYGEKWELEVASIGEAVRAIEANRSGFADDLRTGGDYGVVRGEDLDGGSQLGPEELTMEFKSGDLHICPVAAGSGFTEWLQVIAGGLLIAASFVPFFAPAAPWLIGAGASLIAGGIVQMLTHIPDADEDTSKSYLFSGVDNLTRQGGPVPLVYGGLDQPVFVGSTVISQGIEAVEDSA